MSDLISREAAIDAICNSGCGSKFCGLPCDDVAALKALPSAQPEQRWIPCNTALPKDEEEVIASIHDNSGDYAYDYTTSGWYAAAGEFWVVDNEANMCVTAWMPLPEPYREVSE